MKNFIFSLINSFSKEKYEEEAFFEILGLTATLCEYSEREDLLALSQGPGEALMSKVCQILQHNNLEMDKIIKLVNLTDTCLDFCGEIFKTSTPLLITTIHTLITSGIDKTDTGLYKMLISCMSNFSASLPEFLLKNSSSELLFKIVESTMYSLILFKEEDISEYETPKIATPFVPDSISEGLNEINSLFEQLNSPELFNCYKELLRRFLSTEDWRWKFAGLMSISQVKF